MENRRRNPEMPTLPFVRHGAHEPVDRVVGCPSPSTGVDSAGRERGSSRSRPPTRTCARCPYRGMYRLHDHLDGVCRSRSNRAGCGCRRGCQRVACTASAQQDRRAARALRHEITVCSRTPSRIESSRRAGRTRSDRSPGSNCRRRFARQPGTSAASVRLRGASEQQPIAGTRSTNGRMRVMMHATRIIPKPPGERRGI